MLHVQIIQVWKLLKYLSSRSAAGSADDGQTAKIELMQDVAGITSYYQRLRSEEVGKTVEIYVCLCDIIVRIVILIPHYICAHMLIHKYCRFVCMC